MERLTNREREIYNLLLKGFTIKHIADILILEPTTVNTHTTSIMYKAGVNSRLELLAMRIEELEKEVEEMRLASIQ